MVKYKNEQRLICLASISVSKCTTKSNIAFLFNLMVSRNEVRATYAAESSGFKKKNKYFHYKKNIHTQ